MNKRINTLFAILSVCIVAMAGPVTPKQAQQKALNFMNKDGVRTVKAMKLAGKVQKGATANNEMLQDYYVFNADNNKGFVIISGEDRLPEVFGYGEGTNLDTENIPENMKTILDMYARLVKYVASQPEDYKPANISLARRQAKQDIAPLLQTNWDQDRPYNTLCPKDGYRNSYTGCAATSMAQVMYHHKWPEGQCKEIPGYYTRKLDKNIEKLPPTTFKWESMKNTYKYYDQDPYKAVATLMQYCGHSIEMSYSADGSGAYSFIQPYALKKYFGYDKKTRIINRDDFTLDVWNNIIYNELASNRPVVYSGVTSKQEGHSFVIDGYRQSDGFYHVNWGWNGTSDNYFDITVLNPDNTSSAGSASTNEGFALEQDAIIGMQKPTGVQEAFEEYLTSKINYVRDNTIECSYANMTPLDLEFEYGLGYYDENGKIVVLKSHPSVLIRTYYSFQNVKYDLKDLIRTPGTYQIFPISKSHTAKEWQPSDVADYIYVKTVLEENGNMTNTLYPVFAIQIDKVQMSDISEINKDVTITYTIKNNSDAPYSGTLYLYIASKDSKDKVQQKVKYDIPAKGSQEVKVKFTPKRNSEYQIILASDDKYNNRLSDETHQIGETRPSFESNLDIENAGNQNGFNYLYSSSANGKLSIKNIGNSAYKHNIKIELACRKNGMYVTQDQKETPVNIAPNETIEVPFNFSGLTDNKKYMLRFSYEFNEYIKFAEHRFTSKLSDTNAIETTEAEAQDNSNAPVYDITGRKVMDGANDKLQRGIYIKNGRKYVNR